MKRFLAAVAVATALVPSSSAFAQATFATPNGRQVLGSPGMCTNSSNQQVPWFNSSGTWQCAGSVATTAAVTGTFTASGFQPTTQGSPISATTGGATGSLPAGTGGVAQDVGGFPAYCQFGSSATGITSGHYLSGAGAQWAFLVPSGATQITCEGVGGTTAINLYGGSGLGVDTGGGGSGSSGGNVTVVGPLGTNSVGASVSVTPATSSLFPISATSLPLPTSAATSSLQTTGNSSLSTIAANMATAANQEVTAAGTTATSAQAFQGVTGGVPVPISGSVNPFAPNGNYSTPLTVGATSSRIALPSGGGSAVAVYNTGSNAAFVELGNSSVVATASNDQIPPGGFLCFGVGTNVDIAAIETAGATTLNISGGSGACSGSGGGGSGGTVTANLGTIGSAATAANQEVTSAGTSAASAQGVQGVTGGVPLNVAGSFSASFAQFDPNGNYSTPLSVSGTSSRTALPSGSGSTVAVYNTGSNPAFVALGSSAVIATASNDQVAPGGFLCFGVGTNVDIAAIETAGATTLNISGGSGACSGSGGGGGGGSGSNASVGSNGSAAPGSSTQVGGVNPSGNQAPESMSNWNTAPSSSQPVFGTNANVLVSVLPTGAATSALQTSGNSSLTTIAANTAVTSAGTSAASAQGVQGVTGGVPMPVTATSFPLPTGAATSALQTAGNSSLTSINSALGSLSVTANIGTVGAAASAANQTNASQKTQIVDGSGSVIGSTSNSLNVHCDSSCASGGGSGGGTPQTTASKPVNISGAATTSLISHTTGDYTYVTGWDAIAGGTGTFELEYGTTTTNPCDTGTQALTGAYPLTAQAGAAKSAQGTTFVVPQSNDVCAVTTGSGVQFSGSIQYTQSATAISSFGGGGGSSSPFVSNGNYINNTSVATSSTNAALTSSPAALLVNNIGTFPIMLKAVSTSGGSVTAATADLVVPANSVMELGTNGNGFVAYAAVGGTGSVQITEGSGTFTGAGGGGGSGGGSATAFQPTTQGTQIAATTSGVTGSLPTGTSGVAQNTGSYAAYCQFGSSATGIVSGKYLAVGQQWGYQVPSGATQITCEGVSGTTYINLYGGSGLAVDTGAASSGSTQDNTLTATGTLSAADSGCTTATWTNGQPVITCNPATTGSTLQFSGFSGAQTGLLICYGTTSATLELDTLMDTASPGHYAQQTITQVINGNPSKAANFTMSGSSSGIMGKVNLAEAVGAQIRATGFTSSSSLTCTLRLSTNIADLAVSNLLPRGSSIPINISTATTTQLVALSGTKSIYVSAFDVMAGGTGNITFEYGTGSNCGSGTTPLTGAYPLTAQQGFTKGDGMAPVLIVPAGNALCALTSAAVQMSGSLTYVQY